MIPIDILDNILQPVADHKFNFVAEFDIHSLDTDEYLSKLVSHAGTLEEFRSLWKVLSSNLIMLQAAKVYVL